MPKNSRPIENRRSTPAHEPLQSQQPLVSGRWLLSAIGIVIALAAACAYGALCLLFYQGSWQLIFHPSHTITTKPSVPFQDLKFDFTETGKPQLSGWWIPATDQSSYAKSTILFLRDGQGSLSNDTSQLDALHRFGINLFAFDYRGFGQSDGLHPSEWSLNQDASAAWSYLVDTRHLSPSSIVIYGTGVGASVAITLAASHPETPALILREIGPTALVRFSADARARIIPVRLLTSDRFDPEPTLKTLRIPTLFINPGGDDRTEALYRSVTAQKTLVGSGVSDADILESTRRFLDAHLPHP